MTRTSSSSPRSSPCPSRRPWVPPADSIEPGDSAAAPGQQAEKNAAKSKDMRKNNAASYATLYGTKPNALRQVRVRWLEIEDRRGSERRRQENAAKACKKERDQLGATEFKTKYAP